MKEKLNKISEWITKNQTKIYIIGGVLLLLIILSPYFLSMPELMFGLLVGALAGFLFNKVINNTVERRSIKLNVKDRESSSTESGESRTTDPGTTGSEEFRARINKINERIIPTRITIPSVEDEPGNEIQGDSAGIIERDSETQISDKYAGQDTVPKPSNQPDVKPESISPRPDGQSGGEPKESESDSGESEQPNEEHSSTTRDYE